MSSDEGYHKWYLLNRGMMLRDPSGTVMSLPPHEVYNFDEQEDMATETNNTGTSLEEFLKFSDFVKEVHDKIDVVDPNRPPLYGKFCYYIFNSGSRELNQIREGTEDRNTHRNFISAYGDNPSAISKVIDGLSADPHESRDFWINIVEPAFIEYLGIEDTSTGEILTDLEQFDQEINELLKK